MKHRTIHEEKHEAEKQVEEIKTTPPLPPPAESPIPFVEVTPPPLLAVEDEMTDDKFTGGIYIHRKTKEPYALYKHEPDGYERTHSCKNTVHFWQGNEDEFNLTFERA